MKIKKAVIPVAGLGTRFLPATKAQPKEMLPVVGKPAVQYIVEEAVQAGIESIIFVTGKNKKSIEDHFDKSTELERMLEEKGKIAQLKEVQSISSMANIYYIRQKEPLGLGHAVLCAKQFIGDDPFAVLLGDDIMISKPPAIKQMMNVYERTGVPIVGVQQVPLSDVSKYGIINPSNKKDEVYHIHDLIEKPDLKQAPSNLAILGRYILNPSIFPILETIERGAGNEIQLTDGLRHVCKKDGLMAIELQGNRYDIGDQLGYTKAIAEIGLQRPELRSKLLAYFDQLLKNESQKKELVK
ncbi:UTP--glucose-1-phosphate uridylyltransferase GalU [Cytobacillus sp. IB215665]|uniref:UTP--glucose-1-phosphate uridylyltransferase GalU n=1 Tax=Cytobacillus sp. IB215665 TaxID=3097357 RepID=UPI002A182634|nr:UTP--glucose-1-phosphate uridylyltransferase GalU [Cytobacillus sp. IB215665]MDX8366297.1 UTP--glucose-1-phosphate uridylyltransferase GalU [Cytobacillus sp. IB215665]